MPRILLALSLFLASVSMAQTARFEERVEVKLIEIDVVVTDRGGNRVYGLTKDDFELFEGRARQTITNFTEYRSESSVISGTLEEAAPRPPGIEVPEPRTILVVVDSLPRTGLVRRETFKSLQSLVERVMREGDRVGFVLWDPGLNRPRNLLDPTTNVARARAVITALRESFHAATEEIPDLGEQDFFEDAEENAETREEALAARVDMAVTERFAAEGELMRFRRKIRELKRVVSMLGGGTGRKAVFYVSHHFALPRSPDTRLSGLALLNDLVKAANAIGVTFYAVRPHIPEADRGAGASEAPSTAEAFDDLVNQLDTLTKLVEPTGGLLDNGLDAVDSIGQQMTEDLGSYYSLAYRARSDGRDRERRLTVRTKNRAYRVRGRDSFIEKSNETLAKETLIARLFSDEGGTDLTFDLIESEPQRTSGNRWLIPIKMRIPASQLQFVQDGTDQVARVKILIVSGNGVAEMTKVNEDEIRIVRDRNVDPQGFVNYSVQILADKRGSETSIGVFDVRSGFVGVRTIDNRGRFANASAR